MRVFTLATLLCALAGCAESDKPEGHEQPEPQDPVEAAAVELGTAVTGCADTGFADNTLTLTLTTDPAVVSAPGGKITVNGYVCTGTVGSNAGTPLTTTNVRKIDLNGTAGANKVILDLLPGSFGTSILGSKGGITVDFSAGGDDSFMIRGGVSGETYKFAQSSSAANDFYVEITGDKVADIWVKGSADDMTIAASMGAGNDTVIGNPTSSDIATFAGSAIMVEPMTRGFTAYGGAGDDKFTGGEGDDTFHGGANNDTFRTASAADGADTYIGDDGIDTVDYSNRTMPVFADIGPEKVSVVGTTDLATTVAAIGTGTLEFDLDESGTPTTVTFASPTNPAEVLSQINAVTPGVASLTGRNQLMLSALTSATTSKIEITGGSALASLGFTMGDEAEPAAGTATPVDADDGYAGEGDDIRPTTENITGGSGNDVLVGDASKNVLKGGGGDDHLMGGSNSSCTGTSDGDLLQGEAGNDTFWLPVANCYAQLSGGAGDNTVDFSGRSDAVQISNNGVANDGENAGAEAVNVATDILKMIGGFGADTITGGSGNDWIIGGLGGDKLSGGAGVDILDYSARTTAIFVTPCFTPNINDCAPAADDGAAMEGDEVHLIEHIKGGSGVDTFDATGVNVDVTFEGNAGADILTGGNGNDILWGDADADTLVGGPGDDNITGGLGVDIIQGGDGDGDICVTDADDTPAATGCEL